MTTETAPPAGAGAGTQTGIATGTAFALLAAVILTAPGCLLAVYRAPHSLRADVAYGSGAAALLLCAAVGTAACYRLTARRLRARLAGRDAAAAAAEASRAHVARTAVPAVIERLRAGASAESALASVPPVEEATQHAVLAAFAAEVHRSETARAAVLSACAGAAGRVQALTTGMAADLREMEHRHADPDVLGDLLHLDHRTAQAGRLADSIAVLTGSGSGRRWAKPIRMESILRGAMGRISGYRRIRLHSTSTVAVAGHAAEGIMHALAELMDNAANFSPPTAEVHVYVEEVASGVVITVEDGGLAMGEVALRRAEQAVSGHSQDPASLCGTRLGLAVVGRLAREHGLTVSYRPSAHGGTGVLLRIPQELIAAPQQAPGRGTATGGAGTDAGTGTDAEDAVPGRTGADAPDGPSTPAADGAGPDGPDHPDHPGKASGRGPADDGSGAAGPHPADGAGAGRQHMAAEDAGRREARDTGTLPAARAPEKAEKQENGTTGAEETPTQDGEGRRQGEALAAHPLDGPTPADGSGVPAHGHVADGVENPGVGRTGPVEYGESGLPLRRRDRTLARPRGARTTTPPPRAAGSTAESAARFGTFRRAVRGESVSPGEGGTPGAATAAPSPSPDLSSPHPEDDAE